MLSKSNLNELSRQFRKKFTFDRTCRQSQSGFIGPEATVNPFGKPSSMYGLTLLMITFTPTLICHFSLPAICIEVGVVAGGFSSKIISDFCLQDVKLLVDWPQLVVDVASPESRPFPPPPSDECRENFV
jgi:hypothetical protein